MKYDLLERLRDMVMFKFDDMGVAQEAIDRIEDLEAALRVYECNGKCANCYGAVRGTKYCGQIARAALEEGKKDE